MPGEKDRNTEEVEAESISYAVCQYFGIETADNSFGYIASWSQGKELKELRASLETINKTSSELISGIEQHYREICKEQGIDLAADAPAQEQPRVPDNAATVQTVEANVPPEAPSPDTPEQVLDEYPMPDESLKAADLEACGYLDGDMLPLSREWAAELYDQDLSVYAIVDGGNAEMLFDREELDTQASGTMFAVSREEWEQSPMFHKKILERQQHQEEREKAFLAHGVDCFAIYQVKRDDPGNVRFMNMDWINSYFLDHPEMVMGRNSSESTAHGMDYTVEPLEDSSLADQLHEAVQHIQGTYQEAELPDLGEGEAIQNTLPADPDVKNFSYTLAEQEKFRDWLKGQSPEEILNHAYEYTVREDILLSLEYHHLSDAQADALMKSPSPLADVFRDFEKLETSHMETVWDCLEGRADTLLEEQHRTLRETPVYSQSGAYAHEHGELNQYRASNEANMACKKAIEGAIRDHYRGYSLDGKAAVAEVVRAFGTERTMYILANTVRQKDWDGRISPSNKDWAKSIPIQKNPDAWGEDRNSHLVVDSHPGLTDLFVSAFRKEYCQQQEKGIKPSVRAKLQNQPVKNSPKISANLKGQER